jgi:hypothetical protein
VLGPLLVIRVVGHSFATAFTVAAVVIAMPAILALAAARARVRSSIGRRPVGGTTA